MKTPGNQSKVVTKKSKRGNGHVPPDDFKSVIHYLIEYGFPNRRLKEVFIKKAS